MKTPTIFYYNTIYKGKKAVTIDNIKQHHILEEQLPREFLQDYPHYYYSLDLPIPSKFYSTEGLIVKINNTKKYKVYPEQVLYYSEWLEITKAIEQANKRLHKIIEKLDLEQWDDGKLKVYGQKEENMFEKQIVLKDFIGDTICSEKKDGRKVFEEIFRLLKENANIILSFKDITILTPQFLNVALGELYGCLDYNIIDTHISIQDATIKQIEQIQQAVKTAKKYYGIPEDPLEFGLHDQIRQRFYENADDEEEF
jgi:DNA-binding transcriptional MerR regulator